MAQVVDGGDPARCWMGVAQMLDIWMVVVDGCDPGAGPGAGWVWPRYSL